MKLAILQMSDTPQVESSTVMLRSAGYTVKVCGSHLRSELIRTGCDTVIGKESAISIGCDLPDPTIEEATVRDLEKCDLFCEIKINNIHKMLHRWPRLERRICFWRVNGSRPEHVRRSDGRGGIEDCGDETNPPCPAITANLWYREPEYNFNGNNYVFWPPYPREADYDPTKRTVISTYGSPFCLCHSIYGWGFRDVVDECRDLIGLDVYGRGSPSGLIPHSAIPGLVATRIAMVHLKGSDCPGWALYESLLGGCPVVIPRWCVSRSAMEELYTDDTCILFGPEPDATGRGDPDFPRCMREIQEAMSRLKDRSLNQEMGMAGRARLKELMWNEERDGAKFKSYLERTFD